MKNFVQALDILVAGPRGGTEHLFRWIPRDLHSRADWLAGQAFGADGDMEWHDWDALFADHCQQSAYVYFVDGGARDNVATMGLSLVQLYFDTINSRWVGNVISEAYSSFPH